MQQFVIDTNFFINLQRPLSLGAGKEEVLSNFFSTTYPLIKEQKILLLTTPNGLAELLGFFEENSPEQKKIKQLFTVASPHITGSSVNAHLVFELVEEIGKRLYRGLRAAEEPIKTLLSQGVDAKNNELAEKHIGTLRDKYRRLTREGFLDSTTDLELIFLAREKDAILVTSDQGVLTWGRKFGCKELLPEDFADKIKGI
jgi:RNA ligase partner protein